MALITRLSRLFQADFNAVLDQIEEPGLQLKQAVREMQLAVDQDKQRMKFLHHEAEQLDLSAKRIVSSIGELDEELEICLTANKDDLARDLIRRKIAKVDQQRAIQQQIESLSRQRQQLDKQVEEQSQRLDSMKQKMDLLVTNSDKETEFVYRGSESIRSEEIEIALLREKQRRAKS
jgi:phage shock protein A